mmetsp:Transcript_12714/g.39275  ORF Transcript_12714/g.39275 Transcript_12714/m.39275 type:complete len:419 (-) Transcript_12714:732-1988(-)
MRQGPLQQPVCRCEQPHLRPVPGRPLEQQGGTVFAFPLRALPRWALGRAGGRHLEEQLHAVPGWQVGWSPGADAQVLLLGLPRRQMERPGGQVVGGRVRPLRPREVELGVGGLAPVRLHRLSSRARAAGAGHAPRRPLPALFGRQLQQQPGIHGVLPLPAGLLDERLRLALVPRLPGRQVDEGSGRRLRPALRDVLRGAALPGRLCGARGGRAPGAQSLRPRTRQQGQRSGPLRRPHRSCLRGRQERGRGRLRGERVRRAGRGRASQGIRHGACKRLGQRPRRQAVHLLLPGIDAGGGVEGVRRKCPHGVQSQRAAKGLRASVRAHGHEHHRHDDRNSDDVNDDGSHRRAGRRSRLGSEARRSPLVGGFCGRCPRGRAPPRGRPPRRRLPGQPQGRPLVLPRRGQVHEVRVASPPRER